MISFLVEENSLGSFLSFSFLNVLEQGHCRPADKTIISALFIST